MELPSLCLFMTATLSARPDRSQFFRYETLSLSCAVPGNFSGWTLRRNTSSGSLHSCEVNWGRRNGSSCINRSVYSTDSGLYWCESEHGECSNVLSITVNSGVVILESPALPVTEGDKVTLRCSYKERYGEKSTSDFNATFYKNGVFIGIQPEGQLVLPAVSMSDEGFYKCQHPLKGESPQSLLSVRELSLKTSRPLLRSCLRTGCCASSCCLSSTLLQPYCAFTCTEGGLELERTLKGELQIMSKRNDESCFLNSEL
ncbi:Fc receptor-like protein 5 isoform X1 [Toxotes jaculatrix]|uniref:Fc receptor-like protein 5 isoform X1 n=1 Tax=Toxotes jaculatrix TaxID=941984 RepID=UPI001B3AE39F|nr:Fc receptor-like protein 5 isoform X1 [Toxotes jaculatrix]